MQFLPPTVTIVNPIPEDTIINTLANAARTCYANPDNPSLEQNKKLLSKIHNLNHMSVFEHAYLQFKITCDRGTSHQLVRHRIGVSFLQESTRYTNYSKKNISFITPYWWNSHPELQPTFISQCTSAYNTYLQLLHSLPPQAARNILPIALATTIFLTSNLRELLHIISLRSHTTAHPDIQHIMSLILNQLQIHYPFIHSLFTQKLNNKQPQ